MDDITGNEEDLLTWYGHKRSLTWSDSKAQIPRSESQRMGSSGSRSQAQMSAEGKHFRCWQLMLGMNENALSAGGMQSLQPPSLPIKQGLPAPLPTLKKWAKRNRSPKIWSDFFVTWNTYNITGKYSSLIFKEKMYNNRTVTWPWQWSRSEPLCTLINL